jgi:ABC-type polysaccharide/polyol phosphate export permease
MRLFTSFVQHGVIWRHLGWRDLQIRYAATRIGPWWSVANLAATVIGSSFAVSLLAGTTTLSAVPRLAIGLTLWTLISASLSEATTLYEDSKSFLLNTVLDEGVAALRLVWRNWLVALHNFVVVILIFLVVERESLFRSLLILPIAIVVAVALIAPVMLVARVVYWKADFRAIIPPFIQFLFFLTPVLWTIPDSGPGRLLLEVNPAAWVMHFAQSVILVGEPEWGYLVRLTVMAAFGIGIAEVLLNSRKSVKKLL